jgi:NADPH-dependent 2,4-dienoyl-CoA reductase/sulfur reductase-like enzyme
MGSKLSKMSSKQEEPVSQVAETTAPADNVSNSKEVTSATNGVNTVPAEASKVEAENGVKSDKTETPAPEEKPTAGSLTEKLTASLSFDTAKIKEKYLAERDKRLRADGNAQYKQFLGQFQHYLTDPYTPRIERDPLDIEIDFLVLGGGFGGLSIAAELMKAGVKDIRVIDKAGDFGGTWYWNRYPGAACDIGKTLINTSSIRGFVY